MSGLRKSEWCLTARWVFPVAGPPLEGGRVRIAGDRIVAVEPHGTGSVDLDLGEAAVLPGLVNAHTHLDLSGLRGLAPPTPDFTAWLRRVINHRRSRSPQQIHADIRAGLAECLAFGTTLVGDISGDGSSWSVLAEAPLRAVVFREILGLPQERASGAWTALAEWLSEHPPRATCRPGISPHAPYSVRATLFEAAAKLGFPTAIHLAETAFEEQLLTQHQGPFVPFLQDLGVWDPQGLAQTAEDVVRLSRGTSPLLLIHGNYLSADVPLPHNASVIYCPRTHAAFGHPPHPFRRLLKQGVRVAIGTDSLASNPDLDVLAEIRFLYCNQGDGAAAELLSMATLAGAEALGWADEVGTLAAKKSADLVIVPLPAPRIADPYSWLLGTDLRPARVLVRGNWLPGCEPAPPS